MTRKFVGRNHYAKMGEKSFTKVGAQFVTDKSRLRARYVEDYLEQIMWNDLLASSVLKKINSTSNA